MNRFSEDLSKAQRPVLLVGGGAWKAREEVRELALRLNIPSVPTWNAIDIITSDFPLYRGRIGTYGMRSGNFTIQNSDLILAMGCRFSGRITGGNVSSFARGAKIYAVDIDESILKYPTIRIDVPICMDAGGFANALLDCVTEKYDFTNWSNRTKEWLVKYPTVLPEYYKEKRYVHPYVFVKTLSEVLTPDDIIVSDCGGNVVVVYQSFETKYGQRMISSHGNSPMGFAFAGAIGACLATERRVICLIGDGGFNMNIQELQTVKNYNIKNLKVFIMNNHIYGITRQFQDTNFGSRYEASGPKGYNPPDFLPIISAYKIMTWRLNGDIKSSLQMALNYPGTIVCDVDMGNFSNYEPRIFGWKTPIEDLYPYLPRNEFKENMIIEPLEGWEYPEMPKVRTGWGEERVKWTTIP